jgi:hypothetical protein
MDPWTVLFSMWTSWILREKRVFRLTGGLRRFLVAESQHLREQALHQVNVIGHHTEQVVAIEA